MGRPPKYKVEIGQVFKDLTVTAEPISTPKGRLVPCVCKCGNTTQPYIDQLYKGKVRSCGCFVKSGAPRRKHGLCGTPTYASWAHMVQRCTNTKGKDYPNYGGRGIRVCSQWLQFENFLADMGVCPEGLSIDRIDNEGDYTPKNCHWATDAEQRENKRETLRLYYKGKRRTLLQVAELKGIAYMTAYQRYREFCI